MKGGDLPTVTGALIFLLSVGFHVLPSGSSASNLDTGYLSETVAILVFILVTYAFPHSTLIDVRLGTCIAEPTGKIVIHTGSLATTTTYDFHRNLFFLCSDIMATACMKDGFVAGAVLDGRFETLSPLNHGSFGMVFLAKDLQDGDNFVAIKCLTKTATTATLDSASTGNDYLLELACHDRLGQHPNIVNLLHAFETDSHMYLVLEYCSMGDLYEAIRLGRGPLKTEHVREFMLQLVDAAQFMHARGLYHRDIKPENIFLAQDGSVKLGDFGLSTTESWTLEASVGSDRYMAPEQYDPQDTGYAPAQADIWAIGICLLNVLFSRNPFVAPTESDLLYSDFVRDRQSLFDVFPNMSQDTFEVLVHALSIDPNKRSLSAMRMALRRVVSFTTDDDAFDDFCTEERDVAPVPASANRQPLRTPSIQSPPIEQGGAFPWAKALHMSPPQDHRQLSTIADAELSEDLFARHGQDRNSWYSIPEQTPSLASVLESQLSASVQSMNLRVPERRKFIGTPQPPMSGSLPVSASKPIGSMASVFGQSDGMFSKSWSDLYEDDEEENVHGRTAFNGLNWSQESIVNESPLTANAVGDQMTPLGIHTSSSPEATPKKSSDLNRGSEARLGGLPSKGVKPPSYSPPSKRSILDKWSQLGNRRRAATHEKENETKLATPRKRTSSGLWRRGNDLAHGTTDPNAGMEVTGSNKGVGIMGLGGSFWDRKDKGVGSQKDTPGAGVVRVKDWRRENIPHWYDYEIGSPGAFDDDDGTGDLEWVGGWAE